MRKLLRTTLNASSYKIRLHTLYLGRDETVFAILQKLYILHLNQRKGCSIPITKKWKTRLFS